jgi:HPt (histidine-containing phosphotransfer) domain-containing protein
VTQIVVDKKALLERTENDPAFLHSIVAVFLADCPGMLADIVAAVAARDPVRLMAAAHALKGSVSFFAAPGAVAAAAILESMGREKKLDGDQEALAVLRREIALVLSALQEISKEPAT